MSLVKRNESQDYLVHNIGQHWVGRPDWIDQLAREFERDVSLIAARVQHPDAEVRHDLAELAQLCEQIKKEADTDD